MAGPISPEGAFPWAKSSNSSTTVQVPGPIWPSAEIEEVAKRGNADLVWRPILVGGVFNAVNQSVYESRANPVKVKARYYKKDMQDWAHLYGLKIGDPGSLAVFPVNSVKAMRGAFVAARARQDFALFAASIRKLLGRKSRYQQGRSAARYRARGGPRRKGLFHQNRGATIQGQIEGQYRRTHRARGIRLAHDFRGGRDVFRQRPPDPGGARPEAPALELRTGERPARQNPRICRDPIRRESRGCRGGVH